MYQKIKAVTLIYILTLTVTWRLFLY